MHLSSFDGDFYSNVLCGIMLATKEVKGLFDTKPNH
jgi:hypothetical protein